MDRNYIDQHHVVARYLADQLTDEELSAFEIYLVEHPDVVEQLEDTARLKVGLMRLQERGQLSTIERARPAWRRPRLLALAASVVAAVVGVAIWLNLSPVDRPLLAANLSAFEKNARDAVKPGARYLVLRMRRADVDARITPPAPPSVVELRVLPEHGSGDQAFYDLTLDAQHPDGRVDRIAAVQAAPGTDGMVTVYLDAGRVKPGRYLLTLNPGGAPEGTHQSSRFTLLVVR